MRGAVVLRIALLVLAGALLAAPVPLGAAHFVEEGNGCYSCHTLSDAESDPETSAIARVSRTLPLNKAFNGGSAPARLGCTYCHSSPVNTVMRDALSHFGAKASKHPVGRNFVTGKETNTEYLSTFASATTAETDCVDCHDAALLAPDAADGSYVDHVAPDDPLRAGNPLMLRLVSTPRRYDDLCRLCHGAAAAPFKGHDARVVSHADAAGDAPIREADGTELRATAGGGDNQCTRCHDTHFSGKVRLLNDGHEDDTAIVSTDCTTVCHYAGDAAGSYLSRGHGRELSTYRYRGGSVEFGRGSNFVNMNLACTACHDSLDTSDTSPTRRPHVEHDPPGTAPERYRRRYNISLPLQGWDTGSVYGNPQAGVCQACHAAVTAHRTQGGEIVGCLDCHDEHAERSGKANVFMLPMVSKKTGSYVPAARNRAGTKAVLYTEPRLDPADGAPRDGSEDFFRDGDRGGICDNAECHPSFTPLADFMEGRSHTGGEQPAGSDCGRCHPHNGDPAGGWRATASPRE